MQTKYAMHNCHFGQCKTMDGAKCEDAQLLPVILT